MDYIYLMFWTEIVLLIIAFVFLKDVLSPALITLAGFSVATFCVVYNVDYWAVSFSKNAYMILAFGLVIILLEEIVIVALKDRNRSRQIKTNREDYTINGDCSYKSKSLPNRAIIIMCCLFFIYLVYDIYQHGLSLGINGLRAIGAVHESDIKLTAIGRLGKRFIVSAGYVYSFMLCYNVVLCRSKIKNNIIAILPVILAIISNIVTANRIGAVRIILGFAVILYITWMDSRNWRTLNFRKLFSLLRKSIVPVVIMLIGFYYLREIVKGRENNITILNYITYYFGSSIHLFSDALNSFTRTNSFGGLTFSTLYDNLASYGLLGASQSSQSIDFISIGGQWGKGGGNVFTVFYRPMADYGIIGMYVFIAIMYGIYDYVYYFKIKKVKSGYKRNRRVLLYAYFFWGVAMSFYDYVLYADFSVTGILNIVLVCVLYWLCTRIKLVL